MQHLFIYHVNISWSADKILGLICAKQNTQTPDHNFIAEYMPNKRWIHAFANSSAKFMRCLLYQSFLCFLPISVNVLVIAWMIFNINRYSSIKIWCLITLCMKLPWFCHTNIGQLFCNCPLFETALLPDLSFGGKQTRRVFILLLLQNSWKLSQFALQDEILQLRRRDY